MLEKLNDREGTQGRENPSVESISREDLACLGGMIAGEGCISAWWGKQSNPKYRGDNRLRTTVSIYNTHPLFIEEVTRTLTKYKIPFCYAADKRMNGRRPGVSIIVDGKGRVAKLLSLVMPYLTCKRRQAELILELISYRESLAIPGRASKGRFGHLKLRDDPKIQYYIDEISREKHEYPSVLDHSRRPNQPFEVPSTTTRFSPPQAVMI